MKRCDTDEGRNVQQQKGCEYGNKHEDNSPNIIYVCVCVPACVCGRCINQVLFIQNGMHICHTLNT